MVPFLLLESGAFSTELFSKLVFRFRLFVFVFDFVGFRRFETTQLLRYEGYDFAHAMLAPPLRPIIAHEVNLEAMRQAEVKCARSGRCRVYILSLIHI